MCKYSVDSNGVHVSDSGEWGYCYCWLDDQNLTMTTNNYTSSHDDFDIQCLAAHNEKPCQFPFKYDGKVTSKLFRRYVNVFPEFSDIYILHII